MDNDLGVYIEQLQLMAFFAGYPLIYAFVNVLSAKQSKDAFLNRLFRIMPYAYALCGALFLGYFLKTLYPDYSTENISKELSYLKIWALLSLLFWLSPFSKRPVISLLHSFVFFFFLLRDLFMYMISMTSIDVIRNDMRVYFDSILLNTGTLIVILALHIILRKFRKSS